MVIFEMILLHNQIFDLANLVLRDLKRGFFKADFPGKYFNTFLGILPLF